MSRLRVIGYRRADGRLVTYKHYMPVGAARDRPNPRLVRQWRILRYLATHPGPVSYSHLSRMFHVSRSAVRKDIVTLITGGFPISKRRSRADDNAMIVSLLGCCKQACPE